MAVTAYALHKAVESANSTFSSSPPTSVQKCPRASQPSPDPTPKEKPPSPPDIGPIILAKIAAEATKDDKPEKECPPHLWVPIPPCKSLEESITENKRLAEASKAKDPEQARGYEFEADAIERKNKLKGIAGTDCIYRCARCKAEAKPDIVFNDGQIAEIASRKAKSSQTENVIRLRAKSISSGSLMPRVERNTNRWLRLIGVPNSGTRKTRKAEREVKSLEIEGMRSSHGRQREQIDRWQ